MTFDENLVAVHMKTKLYFIIPVYLGMCTLDLSQALMYRHHYNYSMTKYGYDAKLVFTNVDSLAYKIKNEDFYKDTNSDVEKLFSTGDYEANHELEMKTGLNSKVLGMLIDEASGKQTTEFVGFRSKLYCYKMIDGNENKKFKGVSKNVVKRVLNLITIENACLANTMRFLQKKLTKLLSLPLTTNE